ncbi:hypothetical protein EN780_03270 [Mesorhizobium sp. M4B.F.Ca.ET.089.01.1.1]|uniref:hypothetical protein n=1 Tax=Mesorhizobium sp. M4B.F.Ca.ET.089.01.1.1 TaxID=2496662 RepID=UPI000FE2BACD|nr:hypothetical protein [Mesorhizobium sp. M4B.F.Ca.ET.089.01.1.1]RWX70428.1 hypothetical protein EN780_03270 [Mesorhizobium sp. M4B.F.Ca.ET.089.01.1.1]
MRAFIETTLDLAHDLGAGLILLGLLIWAVVSPIGFGMAALSAIIWTLANLGLVVILLCAALAVTAAVVWAIERRRV